MLEPWSDVIDGTAVGPVGCVDVHEGVVVVQTVWDDERGTQVIIQMSDLAMTRGEVMKLRELVDQLLETPVTTRT